jgi:type III pantothenate kinase
MFLALNAGNSGLQAGLFRGSRLARAARIPVSGLKPFLGTSDIRGAMLASVVPLQDKAIQQACGKLLRVPLRHFSHRLKLGIRLGVQHPEKVGQDRLAGSSAAFSRYGGPLVVADFGTASTYNAVSKAGVFLGGAIAPGMGILAESLAARTALLPRVRSVRRVRALGKDTQEAIQSGLYHGAVGQAKELLVGLSSELGGRPKIIATGGFSGLMPLKSLGVRHHEPWLVLEGIYLAFEKNFGPA